MRFDAKKVKQMQPGTFIALDSFPGLRMNATASTRTWVYRYKSPIDNRLRQIKLGTWPAMSLTDAVKAWEEQRGERGEGKDPALMKKARRQLAGTILANELPKHDRYTVAHLCADYLANHVEKARKQASVDKVRRLFTKYLDPIAELEPAQVTRGIAHRTIEAMKSVPEQALSMRGELGAAWEYGLDSDRIVDVPNWWRQILRGKIKSKGRVRGDTRSTEQRTLSPGELRELTAWLPMIDGLTNDVIYMYLWTGTRGVEICSMKGSEVATEPDGLWWTIPKEKTKNARHKRATAQRVPLVGRAEEIVRCRMAKYGKGYLFPNDKTRVNGGPIPKGPHMRQVDVTTAIGRCQPYWSGSNKANYDPPMPVTHWGLHDLRRTARTMLSSLGCPREIAEAIIGHLPPEIVDTYDRYTFSPEKRVWLTRLSDHLETLCCPYHPVAADQPRAASRTTPAPRAPATRRVSPSKGAAAGTLRA